MEESNVGSSSTPSAQTAKEAHVERWPEPLVEDFADKDWPNVEADDKEVLSWVMKNKKVLMRVVTWNLCAKPPPSKEALQSKLLVKKFHVYVIGTEECERSIAQSAIIPSKKKWENYLCDAMGSQFVPLRSHTLQAIHEIVFVHRSIAPLCTIVTSAAVATGAGNTLGNKGAVSIYLKLAGTRILIVNAHLSAHQHAERRRNAEFLKISTTMPALLERKENLAEEDSALENGNATSGAAQANSAEVGDNSLPVGDSDRGNSTPQPVNEATTKEQLTIQHETHDESAPPVEAGVVSDVPPAGGEGKQAEKGPAALEEPDEDDEGDSDNEAGSPMPGDKSQSSLTPIVASGAPTPGKPSIDSIADVVVFMGDLNYRIHGNRSIIDKLLVANMHDVLLNNDQLRANMRKGLVLNGYVEPPLNFRPTYKFDRGTDVYDSGLKQRIPSWTDRILYKDTGSVACLAYNCDMEVRTSDHKPVYASFAVSINTFVTLDENQQPVLTNPTDIKFTSESQVCTIS